MLKNGKKYVFNSICFTIWSNIKWAVGLGAQDQLLFWYTLRTQSHNLDVLKLWRILVEYEH